MAEPLQKQEEKCAPPLVTVAMPVYNAGEFLQLAVLSIVGQTFQRWELLIIDDGSTDNALQSIKDINDVRIRILSDGKNKGLAARLNECIDLARGKYLARMDQDDVSYPDRLARQIESLQNDPMLDLVASRAIIIDENNKAIRFFPSALTHEEICARPWRGFHFPHPTWLGKIEWFRKYRYTVPGDYFCEDQELLLRSYGESRFATLDEVLFGYRVRKKTDWKKLAKTRLTVLKIQLRNFVGKNRWDFVLLAIAVYLARMVSDISRRLSGRYSECGRTSFDDATALRWETIMDGLAIGSRLT